MTTFTYGDTLKPPPADLAVAADTSKNPPGYAALKAKFIASLPLRSNSNGSLREAILGLHLLGVARDTLIRWAVDAGYTKSHSRSLISRLFRSLGLCVRKPGAGRKPDPAAVALLAGLRQEYGCIRARKLLRAALRADLADSRNRDRTGISPIVVPQLVRRRYCGPAISDLEDLCSLAIHPQQRPVATTNATL